MEIIGITLSIIFTIFDLETQSYNFRSFNKAIKNKKKKSFRAMCGFRQADLKIGKLM